jgi:flagellar biosynthetic protein FliR
MFSIGIPLTLVLGMVILWMTIGDMLNQFPPLAADALQLMRRMVRAH